MPKSKQPKRAPRQTEPEPQRKKSSWSPLDDLYGNSDGAVDEELELDTGKYERPIPKD